MKAMLTETGLAFSANEYIDLYGNETLLKLLRKFTIRTVDRITKLPKVTKLYRIVKAKDFKIVELPRYCMNDLMPQCNATARKPITSVDTHLP
jgi:hypothetical protein